MWIETYKVNAFMVTLLGEYDVVFQIALNPPSCREHGVVFQSSNSQLLYCRQIVDITYVYLSWAEMS